MVRFLLLFIYLGLTSCSVTKSKNIEATNVYQELLRSVDSYISDNKWINKSDTVRIYPEIKIDKNSCTSYGYYNWSLGVSKDQNKIIDYIDICIC